MDTHVKSHQTQQLRPDSFDGRALLAKRLRGVPATILTWATGVPPSGAVLPVWSQQQRIALAFASFFAGLLIATWGATIGMPLALPLVCVGWSVAIGASRYLQLTVYHYAAHDAVISKVWSPRIGRAIATMLLIKPFDLYAPQHRVAHHGRQTVSTTLDPTVTALHELAGIAPGISVKENKWQFLKTLVSPRFHLRSVCERLAMHFGAQATSTLRITASVWLVGLLGAASAVFGPLATFIGIVLPITIGYQAAQLARLVVEHRWPAAIPQDGKRTAAEHDTLTIPIRCMPLPPKVWTGRSILSFWGVAMVNMWIRLVVLPGDSGPNHHWHHGEARGDWANHIAAAAAWQTKRDAKGMPRQQEAWTYQEALQLVLESFERASWDSISAPARPVAGRVNR